MGRNIESSRLGMFVFGVALVSLTLVGLALAGFLGLRMVVQGFQAERYGLAVTGFLISALWALMLIKAVRARVSAGAADGS